MKHFSNICHRMNTDLKRPRVAFFSLFVLCVLAVSMIFFTLSMGKPYIGAVLSKNDEGWIVESIDANGIASQAGIRKGDTPIEINGQSAQTFLDKYSDSGLVFSMVFRELTVIDHTGQSKSVTLTGSSQTWRSLVQQIAWLVVSLLFWIVGFYVFFKRPRNIAALLLFLTGLTFGLALSANMAAERAIPTALYLHVAATLIGPFLLVHFFLVLPDERTWARKNILVNLIYLPVVITLILFPIVGYAGGQPVNWFRTVRLFEYGVGFLAAAIVVILNYFCAVSFKTRQQMKIVLISCLLALAPFLVLNIVPEVVWRQTVIPYGFSILLMAFIPLGMGYAVVTQKLMDIDIIIRRGVTYGFIAVTMAAILSTAIFPIVASRISVGVPEEIIITLALGGVATALFGPIKRGVELQVDRLFYKDRYEYRQIIQSLSISLNKLSNFADISRLIVGTTVRTLNLAGGCLFVKAQPNFFEVSASQGIFVDLNNQKQLADLISQRSDAVEFPNSASTVFSGLSFLISLTGGEKEVGILCLSQKASRQDFSSDDIYLLQGIASVAAIALHSAMLIRDVSMRDTFVSVASHELRTPLTSIVGYADLLLRRDPPEVTRKRWLKNILDNSQRLSSMVDDLLNVSRIQSGKISIRLERMRLSDVLEETLALTKEGTDKHKFVVDIEPGLPDVLVDRDKFSHVVANLLSNAIKYSPNGGRITLSAHNGPKEHRIILSVADEGIGIGPTDKDSLFTTFHRIQRPETQSIRGSGLGLYIAKEWVEAMGGNIWLESELNKGSTFFVAIPTHDSSGTI